MEDNLDSQFKYFIIDKPLIEKNNEDNIIEVFGFKLDATKNYNDLKSISKNIQEKIKEHFPDTICCLHESSSSKTDLGELNIYIHHTNAEILKELRNHFCEKYGLKDNVAKKIGNWEVECTYYYNSFNFKETFSGKQN